MGFDFFDEMLRDQRESPLASLTVVEGDSREITPPPGIALLWTDPPFGTGKTWTEEEGSYKDTDVEGAISLTIDVVTKWRPMMLPDAVVCICLDDRTIHDVVYLLKKEHGFFLRGEIIWTFGLGRPRTSWWPRRHNTIATFTLSPESGRFDHSTVPREPRHEKHVPSLKLPRDQALRIRLEQDDVQHGRAARGLPEPEAALGGGAVRQGAHLARRAGRRPLPGQRDDGGGRDSEPAHLLRVRQEPGVARGHEGAGSETLVILKGSISGANGISCCGHRPDW